MNEYRLLDVLCSLPIIFLILYYIPFLGVCLILFRCYIYRNRKQNTFIFLIIFGLLLLLPIIFKWLFSVFNIYSEKISFLNNILSSDIYGNLLSYSKLLITIGIILLILSVIFKNMFHQFGNRLNLSIKNYVKQDLEKDYVIRKENDLKMQEKREKAKNTHIVHCPYCGSDNMLTEQIGICKFCRRKIEYKN